MNVEDCVQASNVAIVGDRKIPVFDRLNDRGVESNEVEEGMRKLKSRTQWSF